MTTEDAECTEKDLLSSFRVLGVFGSQRFRDFCDHEQTADTEEESEYGGVPGGELTYNTRSRTKQIQRSVISLVRNHLGLSHLPILYSHDPYRTVLGIVEVLEQFFLSQQVR